MPEQVNEFGVHGYANCRSSCQKGYLKLIDGGQIHLIIFDSSAALQVPVGYITDVNYLFVVAVSN